MTSPTDNRMANLPLKVLRIGDMKMHSGRWLHGQIPDGKKCACTHLSHTPLGNITYHTQGPMGGRGNTVFKPFNLGEIIMAPEGINTC